MTRPSPPLSSVYLDRERIGLSGDPWPQVAKILAASGKDPGDLGDMEVLRELPGPGRVEPLPLEEVIDRTAEPAVPVHLVLAPRARRGDRPVRRPVDARRSRLVAFPNPGSPLPRLRRVAGAPESDARPYESRPVGRPSRPGRRPGP